MDNLKKARAEIQNLSEGALTLLALDNPAASELRELLQRAEYVPSKTSYMPSLFAFTITSKPTVEMLKLASEWIEDWGAAEEVIEPTEVLGPSYELVAESARLSAFMSYSDSGYESVNKFVNAVRATGAKFDHNVVRYLLAQPPLPLTPLGLRSSSIPKLTRLATFFRNFRLPVQQPPVAEEVEAGTPKVARNLAREVKAAKVLRTFSGPVGEAALMSRVPGLTYAEARKVIGLHGLKLQHSPSDLRTITPTSHSSTSPADSTSSTTGSRPDSNGR